MALKSLGADVNASRKKKASGRSVARDCCDDCKEGKECCDEKKPSGLSAVGGARARGEYAAKSSAHKVSSAVQRKYGYSDPGSPGVRIVIRSALQEHASKQASKLPAADRRSFIDGYMSAAEPMIFRGSPRRASGAITRTTGAVMAGIGVAALAGAGIAYVALKPRAT